MIRLGILDFDTSHCVEFTKRLNQIGDDKEQFVEGAKIVDKPGDMIDRVDGMLIEAVDGTVHLERAKPFLEAGIPCFVDKPYACSVDDAKKMAELAAKKKLPIFSSSSLR